MLLDKKKYIESAYVADELLSNDQDEKLHRFMVVKQTIADGDFSPEDAFEALMHDASESLGLGDMVKPLKNMNPDYEAIEDRIECVIAHKFGFRFPYPPSVKIVDKQMLKAEQRQVMFNKDGWPDLADVEIAKVKINFWSPLEAELMFLERFYELMERNT